MSEATKSPEFKTECEKYMSKGTIPPLLLDFWYNGSRNCYEAFNLGLIKRFRTMLEKHIEGTQRKLDARLCEKSNHESAPSIKETYKRWTLDQDEANNDQDMLQYLPTIAVQSNSIFHALTTQPGFCIDSFQQDGKFRMYMNCQPPVNNRDIKVSLMNTINVSNPKERGMFDYAVYTKATKKDGNERFNLSEGHRVLHERKPRANVSQDDLAQVLSPFSTMFPMATTSTNRKDRRTGVKILGDPVAVGCTFESANRLFKTLTVSLFSCAKKFRTQRSRKKLTIYNSLDRGRTLTSASLQERVTLTMQRRHLLFFFTSRTFCSKTKCTNLTRFVVE